MIFPPSAETSSQSAFPWKSAGALYHLYSGKTRYPPSVLTCRRLTDAGLLNTRSKQRIQGLIAETL